jgi:hypothetical protein
MKQKSVFLGIAVLLGLHITATAQTPPSYVPTDGLVGWWPFNGNANDESGNGNNGTVNGAVLSADRFGSLLSAYDFDGLNDFIDCGDINTMDGATELSISLWINPEEVNNYMRIVGKESSFNSTQGINIKCSGPDDPFNVSGVICGNFRTNSVSPMVFTSYAPPLNTWTHVVLVFDGTANGNVNRARIFINGINVLTTYSDTIPVNISNNSFPFWIGGINPNSTEYPFNGSIDDIGVWNSALTQEQVTNLYNANLCYEYITVTDTLIINLGPTGFNPVTYSNTILMYPNPSNDQLTIDYGDYATLAGYTLKIFNGIGQEIHSANINQQQEVLPLGTWGGAGNYQVVIYNAQGVPVDTRTIVLQE